MADNETKRGNEKDAKNPVQFITPPHSIRLKVSGSGGPTPEMLAKAEAAINKLSDDYPTWAIKDVEKLSAMVRAIDPAAADVKEKVDECFRMAHDMRGQGGSFGYPLMTRIANSFCRFIEAVPNIDAPAVAICAAHVDAMHAVISNKVSGTGGEIGGQIAAGLETAVQKYKA